MLTALANRPTPPNGNFARAMYVWGMAPFSTEATQQELITFCASHGVNVLFLDIWQQLGKPNWTNAKANGLRLFLDAAHRSGIRTYGLAGNTDWGTQHRWVLQNIVEPVVAFNAAAILPGERLDGMILDVEYYQDKTKFPAAVHLPGVCELVRTIRSRTGLPVGVSGLVFQKDNKDPNNQTSGAWPRVQYAGRLAQDGEHLMDVADFVVIMAYRNTAAVQIALTKPWFDYAKGQGRDVQLYVASETIVIQPAEITYAGKTKAQMEAEHTAISNAFSQDSAAAFVGQAVHSYDGWRAMR